VCFPIYTSLFALVLSHLSLSSYLYTLHDHIMNRTQQAARLALRQRRAAVPRATRKYATQPPPPAGQPAPNFNKEKSGTSGGLIGLVALTGAAAGAWYYYGQVRSRVVLWMTKVT
jgi:hypothetical protein